MQQAFGQSAIWIEDFDDGGGGRWTLENAPGSLTNPTPAGIVGLTYGVNAAVAHDNFVINDRNTPELDADIVIGTSITGQGQLVRGRHYACVAPSNLPNPFINGAAPGPNQSLHITAYATCATLLYGGTAQSDDWNCISDPDNGDVQTQTEQIAYLNNNIDATGSCNLVLTADFFLGGDSDGIKSHGTILYSVDAGVTWEILEDNLSSCSPFLAGTCNNWFRRSFEFPANANNQNDIRLAFRWYDDGDINDTGDYALGASFNVDNLIVTACDVPTADFYVSQSTGCKGDEFTFTDQSTTGSGYYTNCASLLTGTCAISGWTWDIAKPGPPGGFNYINGTNANSQNPQVEFTANGTYTVTLTATNCAGDGVLVETDMIVIDDCPPVANFTTSQLSACADPVSSQDTVTFTDLSTSTAFSPITTWAWTFTPATVTYRNGTTAASQNPDVTFDAIGTYQVELTVTNAEGSDTETKVAYIEALDCNCGGAGGGGPILVFEEDFDGNGGAGSNWVTTPLNNTIGAQGSQPNIWYISDAEDGNAIGQCGSAGSGDQSLHISSTSLGDIGAAYDAGGACGILYCVDSDVRSFSNNISTVGVTGLTLDFNYIELGEGSVDNAIVEYSIDGGGSWLTLVDTPKPPLAGCAPQGQWAGYSIALPATCEGIANLKIGYRWMNGDNGTGSDPSFACDDITITGTTGGGSPANTWEGDVSSVWSLAGNWSSNAVPTSADDVLVPATLCGACVMPQIGAAAVARDVCNFGVITINGNNTLTVDRDMLNEGEITTTTTLQPPDVIFANTPSIYKGSGTLYDVDVSVASSDLTLETNMWPRSMDISTTGTFDMDVYTLSVNRNLSKSAGTFTAINGEIEFIDACGGCLDQANTSDVSLDANQVFGNVLVNKSPGIKASLVSAFNYTLNTPKTLTIQSGILDANTFTLNGTGNLTMLGGELQLAKCATILPELTGTYLLPAGKIRFDGICAQTVKQTSVIGPDYFKVQFDGSGVKSLSGNTVVSDSLLFTLPTGLGNYVNAGVDTLFVTNNSPNIVVHTGGHVLGHYNRAFTSSGGVYTFHVGSDNSDLETYFEPLRFTPNLLTGNSNVTARFLDLTPNPTGVVPSIIFGFPFAPDTVEQVETEGYWHMSVKNPVLGGNYTASVSPDQSYWTFAQVWGSGAYTLLKQEIEGDAWDYTANGVRVDDSTTMTFSDFSNYALAYTKNGALLPLSVELVNYAANCDEDGTHLSWSTSNETNSHSFLIERSTNGASFELIGELPAAGNSSQMRHYTFTDKNRTTNSYYRLSEQDLNGVVAEHGAIYVDCEKEGGLLDATIYPNPSNGAINLSVFSQISGIGTVNILDMTGKLIYSDDKVQFKKGFNLSTYSPVILPGVYFISIEVGSERRVLKFTIIQ
jgi:PKD repeat protein